MLDAPKQDWNAYHRLTAAYDREYARNLTLTERFALYADLFQLVCGQQRTVDEQERLDKYRWQEKLTMRQKQNRVFGNLK